MPWSAKAQELLRSQYAAVGAAGRASLPKAVAALQQAADRLAQRGIIRAIRRYSSDVDEILRRFENRSKAIDSSSPPIGNTAGRFTRWTTSSLPRSIFGHRGKGPHRPGSRLAHGDAGSDLPPRSGTAWSRRRSRSSI